MLSEKIVRNVARSTADNCLNIKNMAITITFLTTMTISQ